MITNWTYNSVGGNREYVKQHISTNNYKTIDVGASAMYWSYPECMFVADVISNDKTDSTFFKINVEDKNTWGELLEYVKINGKFDFSICSHTLEDVFNPLDLIGLLTSISNKGFIAIPSKYDEYSFLYNNKYRGNAHHKQFFDIKDNSLIVYPKFSWSETDERSNEITNLNKGGELSFFWETKIPVKVFGRTEPFKSDQELMNNFYNELIN
jgi:hypothetical protein